MTTANKLGEQIVIQAYSVVQEYILRVKVNMVKTLDRYEGTKRKYIYNKTEFEHMLQAVFDRDKFKMLKNNEDDQIFLVSKNEDFLVEFDLNIGSGIIDAIYEGSETEVNHFDTEVLKYLEESNVNLTWVYMVKGDLDKADIRFTNKNKVIDEMYPFLKGESIQSYYARYMKSSAPILLLIGPPGTGKTSFIKGFIDHIGQGAYFSYDKDVLTDDGFFIEFVTGRKPLMVIEDCDLMIGRRTEGNEMMNRFLNVADGFLNMQGKKMIFTTNLQSLDDVDPALLRKGRCFDILHFDKLTYKQAENLAKVAGIPFNGDKDEYTIADVFCAEDRQSGVEQDTAEKRKVGFVP